MQCGEKFTGQKYESTCIGHVANAQSQFFFQISPKIYKSQKLPKKPEYIRGLTHSGYKPMRQSESIMTEATAAAAAAVTSVAELYAKTPADSLLMYSQNHSPRLSLDKKNM